MMIFPSQPFRILPARFLLIGLLVYVVFEMVAAISLDYFPQLGKAQQSIVLLMRLFELGVFCALIYHFKLRQSLGLSKPTLADMRIFLQISLCCVLLVGALFLVAPQWFFSIQKPAWIHGVSGLLLMVLLAPVVEELIFRGLLYRMLREQWGVVASVAVSAVFFSLLHQGQIISPQLAGGIIFALAYEWSRSLWVAIGLHIGANSAVYALSMLA